MTRTARPLRRSAALFTAAWLFYGVMSTLLWWLYGPAAWALATFLVVVMVVLLAKSEHDAEQAERAEYQRAAQDAIRAAYLAGRNDRPEVTL